jgi:DNA (cytosine-5)-methyltransferase 1
MKRALDLFCGVGGATRGLQLAGFHVTGIDHVPQPRYCGDAFVCCDALLPPFRLSEFDLVWASPPCQAYSVLAAMHPGRIYPDLVADTRTMLQLGARHWVIENVPGAPLLEQNHLDGRCGVLLCGTMFGLGVERGELRRHRIFESSFPIGQPVCRHKRRAVGVYGHGGRSGKHRMLYRKEAAEAMQMPWSDRDGMTQAIPPAYSEWIGKYALMDLGFYPAGSGQDGLYAERTRGSLTECSICRRVHGPEIRHASE